MGPEMGGGPRLAQVKSLSDPSGRPASRGFRDAGLGDGRKLFFHAPVAAKRSGDAMENL